MFYKSKKERRYESLNRDYYSMEKYADEMKEKNIVLYKIIKKQDEEMINMRVKYKQLEESKIPQIKLYDHKPKPIKCWKLW